MAPLKTQKESGCRRTIAGPLSELLTSQARVAHPWSENASCREAHPHDNSSVLQIPFEFCWLRERELNPLSPAYETGELPVLHTRNRMVLQDYNVVNAFLMVGLERLELSSVDYESTALTPKL